MLLLTKKIEELNETMQASYKFEGKSKGAEITLTVNAPSTYIDFENSTNNVNIPAGQDSRIYFPSRKIAQLILINEGQADVRFDINTDPNETFGFSVLRNGRIRSIDVKSNKIYSILVHAIINPDLPMATTARVRLEYLY